MTSSASCTATPIAESNKVTLTVDATVTPAVTIKADKNTICPGEEVVFTSTATNQGVSPTYDWLLNGTSTGVQTATYSNSSLSDNDKITVVLTSSETCSSGSMTSSGVIIKVGTPVTPISKHRRQQHDRMRRRNSNN